MMKNIFENEGFSEAYAKLAEVSLNPRRHSSANARAHSDDVARVAARLAEDNACSDAEISLLRTLGYAHDIGKITGSAQPARSLQVLADCGITEPALLSLAKWHDTALPWYRAARRGTPPSDKAWRRIAGELDMRLLCIFMVADRSDAPGGWRRNPPTTWFIDKARKRGLLGPLSLDLLDHPSERCAGAALVQDARVLLIRTQQDLWELPKGGLEWDERPEQAALRELREEAGISGEISIEGALGSVDYLREEGQERWLKRVSYFRVRGAPQLDKLPKRTRARRWVGEDEFSELPLVGESLRPLLRRALSKRAA